MVQNKTGMVKMNWCHYWNRFQVHHSFNQSFYWVFQSYFENLMLLLLLLKCHFEQKNMSKCHSKCHSIIITGIVLLLSSLTLSTSPLSLATSSSLFQLCLLVLDKCANLIMFHPRSNAGHFRTRHRRPLALGANIKYTFR